MNIRIRRNEPPDKAIRRIASEQIGVTVRYIEDPDVSYDEKIHSLRTHCKKMRALLRLAGPVMGEGFRREDARFKDAAAVLGGLRDDFVVRQTLRELVDEADAAADNEAAPDADARVGAALSKLRQALAAVPEWPLPVRSFYDLAPGYGRTYRKARKAWRRARIEADDERFHRLRRWSKYLWYQTRFLERVNREDMRRQRRRLRELGTILGQAHDLAVFESSASGSVDPDTMRVAGERKRALYRRALKLSGKTYALTTDEQVACVAHWWQQWRRQAD